MEKVQFCGVCNDAAIRYICVSHKVGICQKCYDTLHKGCQIASMDEYEQASKSQIQKFTSEVVEPYKQNRAGLVEKIQNIFSSLEKSLQQARESVQVHLSESDFQLNKILGSISQRVVALGMESDNYAEDARYMDDQLDCMKQFYDEVCKSAADFKAATENLDQNMSQICYKASATGEATKPDHGWGSDQSPHQSGVYILPTNSSVCQSFTVFYSKKENEIYAFGINQNGQLGSSKNQNEPHPIKIKKSISAHKIYQISCGSQHTLVVTDCGLFGFGSNYKGQLACQKDENITTPRLLQGPFKQEQVQLVACGSFHSIVATTQNNIYAFGQNNYGQLGIGSTSNSNEPVCITKSMNLTGGDIKIRGLNCGMEFTAVLTNKDLYLFGYNGFGQLGNGTRYNYETKPLCRTSLFKNQAINSVTCGGYHTVVLTNTGVYTFGRNDNYQLGDGTNSDQLKPVNITKQFSKSEKVWQVCCGEHHTLFLTNLNLYGAGFNTRGQIGVDKVTNSKLQQVSQKLDVPNILQISGMGHHTLIETNHSLLGFGDLRYLTTSEATIQNGFTIRNIDFTAK